MTTIQINEIAEKWFSDRVNSDEFKLVADHDKTEKWKDGSVFIAKVVSLIGVEVLVAGSGVIFVKNDGSIIGVPGSHAGDYRQYLKDIGLK